MRALLISKDSRDNWLSDEIINAVGSVISHNRPGHYFLSSMLLEKEPGYFKYPWTTLLQPNKDFTLYAPLNIDNRHWRLAIIKPKNNIIYIVDSLPSHLNTKHNTALKSYIQEVGGAQREWKLQKLPSPQQKNSFACGFMTLCRALDYVEGVPFQEGITDPLRMAETLTEIILTRYLPRPTEAIMAAKPGIALIHQFNDELVGRPSETTMTSTDQVLNLMVNNGMTPQAHLLVLGAGTGNTCLHALLGGFVTTVTGVERDPLKWHSLIRKWASLSETSDKVNQAFLAHSDLTKMTADNSYTHVIMNDKKFPPAVLWHLGNKMSQSKSIEMFLGSHPIQKYNLGTNFVEVAVVHLTQRKTSITRAKKMRVFARTSVSEPRSDWQQPPPPTDRASCMDPARKTVYQEAPPLGAAPHKCRAWLKRMAAQAILPPPPQCIRQTKVVKVADPEVMEETIP